MSLSGGRPFWMSGSSRQALLDVREALPVVWVWSGDPYGCPVVVVVSPGCPGVVRGPSRISGSGWEALSDVREWLRG